jgi:hypothetical protein
MAGFHSGCFGVRHSNSFIQANVPSPSVSFCHFFATTKTLSFSKFQENPAMMLKGRDNIRSYLAQIQKMMTLATC